MLKHKKGIFLVSLGICLGLAGCATSSGQTPSQSSQVPQTSESISYQPDFKLTSLSADPIKPLTFSDNFVDPAYGTQIYRLTNAKDEQTRMRHEYSRRQAFNADQSRLLAQDGSGHWFLYDTKSRQLLQKLPDLAGDSEPIWHASDPNKLYFTSRGGGLIWWLLDLQTGQKQVVYDFSKDTIWPEARSYWTRGEGTTSADGRYLALMATTYDSGSQTTKIYGLVVLDLVDGKVIGRLDAKDFPVPNVLPDHISTAPSGRYAVVSWLAGQGGTVAYTTDFKKAQVLTEGSEHSDLAIGPRGQDLLVYANYQAGYIQGIDLETGRSENLHPLYPAPGQGYALHISGQAFNRPGWVVISTYADFSDYGQTYPAKDLLPEYRKIWLLELIPNGRRLNVAHIRSDEKNVSSEQAYFLEPQASTSRDLTRIVFASNFSGVIESYVIELPAWVLD